MKIVKPVLTFIGGVAVGILAVTGVYAMEEQEKASCKTNDETIEQKHEYCDSEIGDIESIDREK